MKPPSNSERIYLAVKREVLSGRFAPGERVDAVALAQEQFASITPIRAALYRLVGERLVHTQASEGFHAPPLTEVGLRDLFACNGQILVHAIVAAAALRRRGEQAFEATLSHEPGDVAEMTERVFLAIARSAGSEECTAGIASFNDRLHAVRALETRLVPDQALELESMRRLIEVGDAAALRAYITTYHRRRIVLVPTLVRLRHRTPAE